MNRYDIALILEDQAVGTHLIMSNAAFVKVSPIRWRVLNDGNYLYGIRFISDLASRNEIWSLS